MAPIGLSQMIVPASQHTLFMRGFAGNMDKEDIREYFTREGGKCSFDFIKLTEDRRFLYVALRFDSKDVAKDIMSKYNDAEVLGSRIKISWYKDLRKARHKALEAMRERRMHFRREFSPETKPSGSPVRKRRPGKKSTSFVEGSEEGEIRNSGSRSGSSFTRRSSSLASITANNVDGGLGHRRSPSIIENGGKSRSISKGSLYSGKGSPLPLRDYVDEEDELRRSRSLSVRRRKHKRKGKKRRRLRSGSLYSDHGMGPASPEPYDRGLSKDPDPSSLSLGAAIKQQLGGSIAANNVANGEDLEAYEEEDGEIGTIAPHNKDINPRHRSIERSGRKSPPEYIRKSRSLSREKLSPGGPRSPSPDFRNRREDSKENRRPRRGRPSGRNLFRRSPRFRRGGGGGGPPRSPRFKGPMDDEARERLIKDRATRNRQKYIQQQMGQQYEEYLKKEQADHQKLMEANEKALIHTQVNNAITYKRGGSEIYGFSEDEDNENDGKRRGRGGRKGHRRRLPKSPTGQNEEPSPSNVDDVNVTKVGLLNRKNKVIEDLSFNKPVDPSQFFKNTMTDVAKDSAGNLAYNNHNAFNNANTGYPIGNQAYMNSVQHQQQHQQNFAQFTGNTNAQPVTLDAATIKNIKDKAPPGSDPDQFLASVLGEDAPSAAMAAAFQHHFQMLASNTGSSGQMPPIPILNNNQPAPPSKININLKMFASNMAANQAANPPIDTQVNLNSAAQYQQYQVSATNAMQDNNTKATFESNLKESYAQFMNDVTTNPRQEVENVNTLQDNRAQARKKRKESENAADDNDEYYEGEDDWRHMGGDATTNALMKKVIKKSTRGQRLNEELRARLQDLEMTTFAPTQTTPGGSGKRKRKMTETLSDEQDDEGIDDTILVQAKRSRNVVATDVSASGSFKFKTLGVLDLFKKQMETAFRQDCSVLYGVSKLLMIDENIKASIKKGADENINNLVNTCINQLREIFQRIHQDVLEE